MNEIIFEFNLVVISRNSKRYVWRHLSEILCRVRNEKQLKTRALAVKSFIKMFI